jgi:hypothetical protein
MDTLKTVQKHDALAYGERAAEDASVVSWGTNSAALPNPRKGAFSIAAVTPFAQSDLPLSATSIFNATGIVQIGNQLLVTNDTTFVRTAR